MKRIKGTKGKTKIKIKNNLIKSFKEVRTLKVAVVYYSRTGQTRRFIEKLSQEVPDLEVFEIKSGEEEFSKPYVLITPTYNYGSVPEKVETFLRQGANSENMLAVASGGNTNWGKDNFCMSGYLISEKFKVPWIRKFELQGSSKDVQVVKEEIIKLNTEEG